MPKFFTVEEANALLPQLREILADLARVADELEQVEAEVTAVNWQVRRNGHRVPNEAFVRQQAAREAISQQISRVHELGCELKDARMGLIDFPSRHEGDVIYLCWKPDEPEVAFWHPIDVGFAGRQPL